MLRRSARKIRDLWIYFKAGHGGYLSFTLSILNFVVLQHRLLISYVPFLDKYLGSLTSFFLFFLFTYFPLATGIGYFEFKKGEMKRRPMLNPYAQDTIAAHILLSEGLLSYIDGDEESAKEQFERSAKILRRWRPNMPKSQPLDDAKTTSP
jgi:hypothetical protein